MSVAQGTFRGLGGGGYSCNEEAVATGSMCSFIESQDKSDRHKSVTGIRYNVGGADS